MEKLLKLPVKCAVPGRPKGKRTKGKRFRKRDEDNGNDASGDEIEDIDDVIPGSYCLLILIWAQFSHRV